MTKTKGEAPPKTAFTKITVLHRAAWSEKSQIPAIFTIGGIRVATSAPTSMDDAEKMNTTLAALAASN